MLNFLSSPVAWIILIGDFLFIPSVIQNETIPMVSVITPTYNGSKFISESIESVISQTYTNWEMIIVDDCSEDGSYEIILEYTKKDSRIKVCRMAQNSGAASCRNKAIELSQGEYLAFLDSDDLWFPEKLEKQLLFMKKNESDFCFTEYEHIDKNGNSLGKIAKTVKILTYKKMLFHDFVGCSTVVYKQDLNNKRFGPIIYNCNDYALFLNVLRCTKNAMGYSEILTKYRISNDSLSKNKFKKISNFFEMMVKYHHKNIFISFFYLVSNQVIKYLWKYRKIANV